MSASIRGRNLTQWHRIENYMQRTGMMDGTSAIEVLPEPPKTQTNIAPRSRVTAKAIVKSSKYTGKREYAMVTGRYTGDIEVLGTNTRYCVVKADNGMTYAVNPDDMQCLDIVPTVATATPPIDKDTLQAVVLYLWTTPLKKKKAG